MEVEQKMKYIINKTKYMIVTTAKEKKKYQSKRKQRIFQEPTNTDTYESTIIVINEKGNLKGHIEELKQNCEAINRETETIESKNQVGKEEIRVHLKNFLKLVL